MRQCGLAVPPTGLLHSLLGISEQHDLLAHPKCGASWEGFALREIIRQTGAGRDEAYFLGLHSGAELDLMTTQAASHGFDGSSDHRCAIAQTEPRSTPTITLSSTGDFHS